MTSDIMTIQEKLSIAARTTAELTTVAERGVTELTGAPASAIETGSALVGAGIETLINAGYTRDDLHSFLNRVLDKLPQVQRSSLHVVK